MTDPLPNPLLPIISATVGALVSILFGPYIAARYRRGLAARAYYAHVSDVLRDFRESIAVIRAIVYNRRLPSMPVLGHITKIAVPDELLTTKIVEVGDLPKEDRGHALWLVNVLVNINRDVNSIVNLMGRNDDKNAFYKSM